MGASFASDDAKPSDYFAHETPNRPDRHITQLAANAYEKMYDQEDIMTKESAIRLFVVLTALVMAPHSLAKEANSVRVHGDSDSISMVEPLSRSFMQLRPDTAIVFAIGNSKASLHLVLSGGADVAVVEDEISQKEIEDASKEGRKLVAREIGCMDIMIIVNRSNPVDELTVKQIADMYIGRITNWKDVGGADIPIACYVPLLPNSATVQWWKSTFLGGESLSGGTALGVSWNGLAYLVGSPKSGKPGAIAFIRSSDLHRLALKGDAGMLKVLRIQKHPQAVGVLPSLDVHGRTNYPIQRPLFAYYDENSKSSLPGGICPFSRRCGRSTVNAGPKSRRRAGRSTASSDAIEKRLADV